MKSQVSKETVVLRRWESITGQFSISNELMTQIGRRREFQIWRFEQSAWNVRAESEQRNTIKFEPSLLHE